MDVREKLAGLLNEAGDNVFIVANQPVEPQRERIWSEIADFLISHGVTVQEWISVKDRLPEDVYGKDREKIVVLVRTKSGNVSQCARLADYDCKTDATLSKVEWIKNGQFYWSKGKKVTHWMHLPEPPKGE